MSDQDMTKETGKGVKTLAIRLEPTMHAQLSLIAQLRGTTLTDEIRAAIEDRLENAKTAPEIVQNADTALHALQEEIDARRAAITALFGDGTPGNPGVTSAPQRSRTGGGKA